MDQVTEDPYLSDYGDWLDDVLHAQVQREDPAMFGLQPKAPSSSSKLLTTSKSPALAKMTPKAAPFWSIRPGKMLRPKAPSTNRAPCAHAEISKQRRKTRPKGFVPKCIRGWGCPGSTSRARPLHCRLYRADPDELRTRIVSVELEIPQMH